jgi:NADH-quinone oxidoreductase subunit E
MTLEFSKEARAEFEELLGRYPNKRAACLPGLYIAQREFGHVSLEAMEYVAGLLELSPANVYGVASFYTMYNKERVGKFLVQVCMNLPCAMVGAEELLEYVSDKLGIKEGETTPDEKFTLMKVECLGACGNAPMMQINDEYYEDLTPQKVDEILDKLMNE